MDRVFSEPEDFRIYCQLGQRRWLFADNMIIIDQGTIKGYLAKLYDIDLDTFDTNKKTSDGDTLSEFIAEEETDFDKAYLIADNIDEHYETELFPTEEEMWDYVRNNYETILQGELKVKA